MVFQTFEDFDNLFKIATVKKILFERAMSTKKDNRTRKSKKWKILLDIYLLLN